MNLTRSLSLFFVAVLATFNIHAAILYGVSADSNSVYEIDTETQISTAIGTMPNNGGLLDKGLATSDGEVFYVSGFTPQFQNSVIEFTLDGGVQRTFTAPNGNPPSGLEVVGDTLWMSDIFEIFSLDLVTGATGAGFAPAYGSDLFFGGGLASDGDLIYVTADDLSTPIGGQAGRIVAFNQAGELVSIVNALPVSGSGGLAFADDSLWISAGFAGPQIFQLDPSNGRILDIFNAPERIVGLASVVPEPGGIFVVLVALFAVSSRRRFGSAVAA